jgi:XTP/dITP diphosphohydrolase
LVNYHKIVLASSNPGKLKEFSELFAPLAITLAKQSDFDVPDAEEPALTFIENAILKARHAARLTGLPALADDSGLAVDALRGAPGIRSARYAGDHVAPAEHIAKLLAAMRDVPDEERGASFHCVLALLASHDDPVPIICCGRWDGVILREPRGSNGFGYDPVFYLPDLQKSAAELDADVKNKISHRGRALKSLLSYLKAENT